MKNLFITTFIAFSVLVSIGYIAYQTDINTVAAWGGGGSEGGGESGTGGGNGCGGCDGSDPTPPTPPDPPNPQPPTPSRPAVCQSLTADVTSLPYGGGDVTLTWSTLRGTSARLTPDGSAVPLNGSKTVTVTNNTTFQLYVRNNDGADTCRLPITVAPQPPVTLSCDSFDIVQTQVEPGDTLNLSWATTNADSASINQGIGSVSVDGSMTSTAPSSDGTYTYTLTAIRGTESVTCSDSVIVQTPNTSSFSCQNNVTFGAAPRSLPAGGGTVSFTWNVTNADSVAISGLSSTAHSGTESVSVTADKTFTLTATKAGYSPISCPVSISVDTGGGGGGSSKPKCKLTLSDDKITKGQEVTLTWDTTRAKEVILKDNHGKTLLDTDDKDEFDGKMKLKPSKDTTYTLVSKRGVRERVCEVDVEVTNNVTVLETRTQDPRVAGISLTQVPYTGFEAGPALTMIFYFILTVWGLFVAYIVVIRRDSIGGVSFAGAHDHVAFTDVSTEADPATAEPVAEEYVESVVETPSYTTPDNLPTAQPAVGYAAVMTEEETDESIAMTELENRAHAQRVLLSSDAMRFFMNATNEAQRNEKLDAVIAQAKASFPSEEGWVTINLARIESLDIDGLATDVKEEAQPETITAGSLAEAIVEGNIVAAYQMIAHRPMVALADAAADLDAVYRARKGEKVSVSDMLIKGTESLTNAQLEEAIAALTGAVDGTYADEAQAVKMAILKAVKAVA